MPVMFAPLMAIGVFFGVFHREYVRGMREYVREHMMIQLSMTRQVQGCYVDSARHIPGSWVGVRVVSDIEEPYGRITMIGSDDGSTFWVNTHECK